MTMRKFSKHTPEQIVVKLDKDKALRGEGMSMAWPAACWVSVRRRCAGGASVMGQ